MSTALPTHPQHQQPPVGSLLLICGKIAAGKSTLAKQLAAQAHTVLISEDAWLAALYADELRCVQDYVRLSQRLRDAMAPHISALLASGCSVVLDFPANTPGTRAWARAIIEQAQAPHTLHFLNVPDEECKKRLRARNASGEHPFQTSDAQFDQISQYFVAPTPEEGFHVVVHG